MCNVIGCCTLHAPYREDDLLVAGGVIHLALRSHHLPSGGSASRRGVDHGLVGQVSQVSGTVHKYIIGLILCWPGSNFLS
jgi:hypothetical protein